MGLELTIFGRTSELCLEIRVAHGSGDLIELENADGKIWRRGSTALPERLSAAFLWKRLDKDWPRRQGILNEAAAELGKWLFPGDAAEYLRRRIDNRNEDDRLLRVELRVPCEVADVPWEIAAVKGIQHLALHPGLTVVRVSDRGEQQYPPLTGQVLVHVVGVELAPGSSWSPLAAAQEVETVRQTIEGASSHGHFSVTVDHRGDWQDLVDGYTALRPGSTVPVGPPQVFHFAGHGLVDGRGLVFRGVDGEPEEVEAERVAQLLLGGRRVRLAFFNACTSSAAGRGPFQPFGGLAALLIQQGIPNVVGLQAPVTDSETPPLAEAFYAALARGDGVDCAIQEARRRLFLLGSDGVGWAFLNLHVSGEPAPLTSLPPTAASIDVGDVLRSFGHEAQQQRLRRFLTRKDPTVIVVHGEEGSAHRHVLQRLQVDLEQAGNVLWRPVAELRLNLITNRRLRRAKLASGIARSLALADDGSPEALERRIAKAIAERTVDRVLVIDLVEELTFHTPKQANWFLTLITELWSDLMHRASARRRTLPVFLLTAVAYPRPLPPGHRKAEKARNILGLAKEIVAKLKQKRRLQGNAQVEVLEELKPFEELYVAEFLEDTLSLYPENAESVAANLVGIHDNETILRNLRNFLLDQEA